MKKKWVKSDHIVDVCIHFNHKLHSTCFTRGPERDLFVCARVHSTFIQNDILCALDAGVFVSSAWATCVYVDDFLTLCSVLRVQQMKWKYFPLYYSSNRFDWLYRCSQFWQTQLMALELLLVLRVGWFGGVLFSFLLRRNIDKYFWIDSRSDAIAPRGE